MSRSDRIRWGGLAFLAGGVLLAVGAVMHPDETVEGAMALPAWGTAHAVLWVSLFFAVLGFTALYARVADANGWMGLAAYVLTIFASLIFVSLTFLEATFAPRMAGMGAETAALLEMDGPVLGGRLGMILLATSVAFTLGYVLFGVAVWKDGRLPKWAGALLAVGGLIMPYSPPGPQILFQLGGVLVGAGAAWLGWTMWSQGDGA